MTRLNAGPLLGLSGLIEPLGECNRGLMSRSRHAPQRVLHQPRLMAMRLRTRSTPVTLRAARSAALRWRSVAT